MADVLQPTSLFELDEAAHELNRNHGLIAVYDICDPDEALAAADFDMPPLGHVGWLAEERLPVPKHFRQALTIVHNASHPARIREGSLKPDGYWVLEKKSSTGFHVDNMRAQTKRDRLSLVSNFTVRGQVMIGLVRVDLSTQFPPYEWSQHIEEAFCTKPGPGIENTVFSYQDKFLPPEKLTELGCAVTVRAGQLAVFSGAADFASGRISVGHQFVTLGESYQEARERLSVRVGHLPSDRLPTKPQRSTW